jgi:hypothetical protein
LGVKGEIVEKYFCKKDSGILHIKDITEFVKLQYKNNKSKFKKNDFSELLTSTENVYEINDKKLRKLLQMDIE